MDERTEEKECRRKQEETEEGKRRKTKPNLKVCTEDYIRDGRNEKRGRKREIKEEKTNTRWRRTKMEGNAKEKVRRKVYVGAPSERPPFGISLRGMDWETLEGSQKHH